MAAGAMSAVIFVIDAIARLYILILLLRLFLPLVGANFQNPLAQAILKLTSPLVVPVRRILPPIGRIDTATVVVTFAVQYLALLIVMYLGGQKPTILQLLIGSAQSLILLVFNLFFWLIIIRIILSWVGQGSYNPAVAMIHSLTEPILAPFRRWIPPIGGFDISPIFALLAIGAVMRLVMGIFQTGL